MKVVRRPLFLLVLNLVFLAACRPTPVATLEPTLTPTAPSATPAQPTTQLAKTTPPPTLAVSPSPTPTFTASPPPATETRTNPPTVLAASPTPKPEPTPTSGPPTSTPTSGPPTPCAVTWFVTNPPGECPGQAPLYAQTVAEHFQHGVLLWRDKPDVYGSQIYAFFFDQKWPYWNPTNDQWHTGLPETDPTIVPPAGFFQPVRGFGMFWRNAYFGPAAGSARDRLGWATDQEFSLGPLPMQCRLSADRTYGCLVAGPDNQVYDVEPNNAWSLWAGTIAP